MKFILSLLFLLFTFSFIYADENKENASDKNDKSAFTMALEIASKEKKSIMVLFSGIDWCPPCQELDKTIISRKKFGEFAKKYIILVTLDFPREGNSNIPENNKLAHEFGIEGFPTMIMVDEKGLPFQKFSYRGQSIDAFIADIENSLRRKNMKALFLASKDEKEKINMAKEFVLTQPAGESNIFFADLIAFSILNNNQIKAEEKILQLSDLYLISNDISFTEKLEIDLKKIDPNKKMGTERLLTIKAFKILMHDQNDEKTYEYYSVNKTKFKNEDVGYLYLFAMSLQTQGKFDKAIEILNYLLTDEYVKKDHNIFDDLTKQLLKLKTKSDTENTGKVK